jgi:hypothetical protein
VRDSLRRARKDDESSARSPSLHETESAHNQPQEIDGAFNANATQGQQESQETAFDVEDAGNQSSKPVFESNTSSSPLSHPEMGVETGLRAINGRVTADAEVAQAEAREMGDDFEEATNLREPPDDETESAGSQDRPDEMLEDFAPEDRSLLKLAEEESALEDDFED